MDDDEKDCINEELSERNIDGSTICKNEHDVSFEFKMDDEECFHNDISSPLSQNCVDRQGNLGNDCSKSKNSDVEHEIKSSSSINSPINFEADENQRISKSLDSSIVPTKAAKHSSVLESKRKFNPITETKSLDTKIQGGLSLDEEKSINGKKINLGLSSFSDAPKLVSCVRILPTSAAETFIEKSSLLQNLIEASYIQISNKLAQQLAFCKEEKQFIRTPSKKYRRLNNRMCSHDASMNLNEPEKICQDWITKSKSLEKQVHDSEERNKILQKQIQKFNVEAKDTFEKLEKTTEELRSLRKEAASAAIKKKTDNARAQNLFIQLSQMKNVVKDVMQEINDVKTQHSKIVDMCRKLEDKLYASNNDIIRMNRNDEKLKILNNELTKKNKSLQEKHTENSNLLKSMTIKFENMKNRATEQHSLDESRRQRIDVLQHDLVEARSLLFKAVTESSERESIISSLKETLYKLKTENDELHTKNFNLHESKEREQQEKYDAIKEVESNVHQLRIENEITSDEMKRIKLDKVETEKHLADLQQKYIESEKKMMEAIHSKQSYEIQKILNPHHPQNVELAEVKSKEDTSKETEKFLDKIKHKPVATNNLPIKSTTSQEKEPNQRTDYNNVEKKDPLKTYSVNKKYYLDKKFMNNDFSILRTKIKDDHKRKKTTKSIKNNTPENDNMSSVVSSRNQVYNSLCCLCLKKCYGLMKLCQCVDGSCPKQAHASCVSGMAKKKGIPLKEAANFCSD